MLHVRANVREAASLTATAAPSWTRRDKHTTCGVHLLEKTLSSPAHYPNDEGCGRGATPRHGDASGRASPPGRRRQLDRSAVRDGWLDSTYKSSPSRDSDLPRITDPGSFAARSSPCPRARSFGLWISPTGSQSPRRPSGPRGYTQPPGKILNTETQSPAICSTSAEQRRRSHPEGRGRRSGCGCNTGAPEHHV